MSPLRLMILMTMTHHSTVWHLKATLRKQWETWCQLSPAPWLCPPPATFYILPIVPWNLVSGLGRPSGISTPCEGQLLTSHFNILMLFVWHHGSVFALARNRQYP